MLPITTRALPTRTFLALALLIGVIAPCPNAAADLPQHVPVQGFAPVGADFANEFSNEAQFGHAVAIRNGTAFIGIQR